MITPDLLKYLKSFAKDCQATINQTVSDSLLVMTKDSIDLRDIILNSMRQELANHLLKKAKLIQRPLSYNQFSREYKAVIWSFTNEELEDLITKVYEAGLSAKEIE
jgi:arsenate reductase-like glutaredoxin family protein